MRDETGWVIEEIVQSLVPTYVTKYTSIAIDSNDYIYVVWNDNGNINYSKKTTSWTDPNPIILDTDSTSAHLIWSWYPEVNGVRTNRPKNGYAFVWNDGSMVKFYKSMDLAWEKADDCESTEVTVEKIISPPSKGDSDTYDVTAVFRSIKMPSGEVCFKAFADIYEIGYSEPVWQSHTIWCMPFGTTITRTFPHQWKVDNEGVYLVKVSIQEEPPWCGTSDQIKRVIISSDELPLYLKAVQLAFQTVGAPYLESGKGWNWNPDGGWDWPEGEFVDSSGGSPSIRDGYYYYREGAPNDVDFGTGLDCSGLIFWAYNKAAGADKYNDPNNPVWEEGAQGQYNDAAKITKEQLRPGDLLFFDEYPEDDGVMDHVAIYTGTVLSPAFNAIHASGYTSTITLAFYDPETETLTTVKSTGEPQILTVDDYGRIPKGELRGKIGQEYTYLTSLIHPEGNQVYNLWSWGDSIISEWMGSYLSGELCEIIYSWEEKGSYKILVKGKDKYNVKIDGKEKALRNDAERIVFYSQGLF
jgi:cell wall-associated NlpC family hydrolase